VGNVVGRDQIKVLGSGGEGIWGFSVTERMGKKVFGGKHNAQAGSVSALLNEDENCKFHNDRGGKKLLLNRPYATLEKRGGEEGL